MSEPAKGTGLERATARGGVPSEGGKSRPVSDIKKSFRETLPPHIHSADSLAKRYWGQTLALVPVFIAACFAGHAEILRVLLICLVSATAFEFLALKLFRKKESLRNGPNAYQFPQSGNWGRPDYHPSKENKSWGGETVLAAVLFSLLMPSRCPSEIVILGVFFAVFVAQELFGGTGSYPLHPVLVARIFLQACFPSAMTEPMLLAGDGSVWTLGALVISGIIFLKQKQGYWETPALFMAGCFFCEALFGGRGMPLPFFSGVLFVAFFLLADPVALPLTRKGTVLFVLGAALLSSQLGPEGFSIRSAACAILLMNLLTPWLDIGLKPVPYKARQPIKATSPS